MARRKDAYVTDPETGWHHGDYWKWTDAELLSEIRLRSIAPGWFLHAAIELLNQHDEAEAAQPHPTD